MTPREIRLADALVRILVWTMVFATAGAFAGAVVTLAQAIAGLFPTVF